VPQQLSLFDVLPAPPRPPGRVLIAQGARAAERTLLERLDSLLEEARKDPALLARPVRIVVPSRSLRLHLSAAIVRRRGRSAAGVILQTLFGLASEVLERSGETAPRGAPLFEAFAQRAARAEPVLRRGLEGLVDGYGTVSGTIRDLLDAGLEPVHAEIAEEALAADGPQVASRAEVERARALVRSAARTEEWMREHDLGRVANLLRRATEIVEADPERALLSRSILIHGYADATGVAIDLIQALVSKCSAWLVLDHPPRPEDLKDASVERAFPARFQERLSLAVRVEPAKGDRPVPPRLEAVEAVGCDAEVREVARRVRGLLDGGARPEALGVVARDWSPYLHTLRRHFNRLGIPFSGVGETGGLEPAGRRAQAFLELLRKGEAVPSDRWLDSMAGLPGGSCSLVDLRLAFYALGAGRLRGITELRLDEVLRGGSYPLPIRQGLKTAPAGGDEELEGEGRETETYASRRRVAGSLLEVAMRSAKKVLDRLASWPDEAAVVDHLARLRSLLTLDLGWQLDSEDARPVAAALEQIARESPPDLVLSTGELRLLLEGLLDGAGAAPLGGQGGGVQVLSVVEARARTFDHLFLIGLNRDVFPRIVREDPLLPDDLRRILQRVLSDVPVKRAGFDEERYLFAQLLSAGISVTLSWQAADDDGKPLAASPLVERLRDRVKVDKAPALWELPAAGPLLGPRTAAEHAVMAGLHAPRRWWGRVLPLALEEAQGTPDPDRALSVLAASRLAVLEELDPDLRTPEGRAVRSRPGPYFGYVGRLDFASGEGEPRQRQLFVTLLENLAACPWQVFLGRLLRLEPTPDPVGALPGIDPLLLGNTVHAVLERIVRSVGGLPADVDGRVGDRLPLAVEWPSEGVLSRFLLEESERLLREEGVFLSGLARALAERARPFLAAARAADWAAQDTGTVSVVGVEEQGVVKVSDSRGRSYRVGFKADRVDRAGGVRAWTDYKTGIPISTAVKEDFRRRHFLDRVRKGSHLQAVAYLLGSEEESLGRYLFLRPDLNAEQREHTVTRSDQDFVKAFENSTVSVLDAWSAGAFFPRLVEPQGLKEPSRCGFCSVAEACLRGDSGARLRLFEWAEKAPGHSIVAAEEALLRVWRLWEKPGRDERSSLASSPELADRESEP